FAAKLVGQRLFFSLRMAKDHGTELTTRASIGAKDLLSLLHRSLEQPVSLARRRFLAFCRSLAQSVKPAVQARGVCRQVPLDFFADLIAIHVHSEIALLPELYCGPSIPVRKPSQIARRAN